VAAALPIRKLAITHADAEDVDAFLALLEPVFPTEKTMTAYMGQLQARTLAGRSSCASSGMNSSTLPQSPEGRACVENCRSEGSAQAPVLDGS